MARVRNVYVVCSECNSEIDRVEYDADAPSAAVQAVVDALAVSEEEAAKLVKKNNPGAELSSEDRAKYLASKIVDGVVEDRAENTYGCPLGHNAPREITDTSPTPLVSTTVIKKEGV